MPEIGCARLMPAWLRNKRAMPRAGAAVFLLSWDDTFVSRAPEIAPWATTLRYYLSQCFFVFLFFTATKLAVRPLVRGGERAVIKNKCLSIVHLFFYYQSNSREWRPIWYSRLQGRNI